MNMRLAKYVPQIYDNETAYEIPEFDLIEIANKMHMPGETVMETLKREAIHGALAKAHGKQGEAAKILGISGRTMNYWCEDLQLRPLDRARRTE